MNYTRAPKPSEGQLQPEQTTRGYAGRVSLYDRIGYRLFMLSGWAYLAAGSFVGFETLAVIVGYATVWPVGVPVAIAGIAVFAAVRRRIPKRSQSDPSVS